MLKVQVNFKEVEHVEVVDLEPKDEVVIEEMLKDITVKQVVEVFNV